MLQITVHTSKSTPNIEKTSRIDIHKYVVNANLVFETGYVQQDMRRRLIIYGE